MKVMIDAGNGEVQEVECDGCICGLVERGKGPTGFWVTTLDCNLSYIEKCRALNVMGTATYSLLAKQIEEVTDEQ